MALKWHPDKNVEDPKAKEKYVKLNEAYEILGDESKRKEYDNPNPFGSSHHFGNRHAHHQHQGFRQQGFHQQFTFTFGGGRQRFNSRGNQPKFEIPSESVTLNAQNFDEMVKQEGRDIWLVQFFTRRSSVCLKKKDEWEKVYKMLGKAIGIGRVDCDNDYGLATWYDVNVVPMILGFVEGEKIKYDGPFEAYSIIQFVLDDLIQTDVMDLDSREDFDYFKSSNTERVRVILYTKAKLSRDALINYQIASYRYRRSMAFAKTNDPELWNALGGDLEVSSEMIILQDHQKTKMKVSGDLSNVQNQLSGRYRYNSIFNLKSNSDFEGICASDINQCVLFLSYGSLSDDVHQKLIVASKNVKQKFSVGIGSIDCDEQQEFCQFANHEGDLSIVFIDTGRQRIARLSGEKLDTIERFVADCLSFPIKMKRILRRIPRLEEILDWKEKLRRNAKLVASYALAFWSVITGTTFWTLILTAFFAFQVCCRTCCCPPSPPPYQHGEDSFQQEND
eukprot:TRINITY_DN15467_c0_g1_i1.p1 TRINITY_DN15467_c0_g1~~TRINITY_DN15467_c0_g1_i1.p1  ORF type:complete len:578 (+),score=150.57 TRINITY_DN15467_c0_g1_i1:222-1736(+)